MAIATLPPKVVGPVQNKRTKATKPLPQSMVDAAREVEPVPFDPHRHLNFADPDRVYSMEEIGREGAGISPVALTTPFRLFTADAINQMRREIFSEEILENHQVSSDFASNMLRVWTKVSKPSLDPHCLRCLRQFNSFRIAPFIYAAWNSPDVLSIMSRLAGIEVVPVFQYDVGHANVSAKSPEDIQTDIVKIRTSQDEDEAAYFWHFDSVPIVCVTMLSDCTDMVGGETAVRLGTGDVMKVRGPTQVPCFQHYDLPSSSATIMSYY